MVKRKSRTGLRKSQKEDYKKLREVTQWEYKDAPTIRAYTKGKKTGLGLRTVMHRLFSMNEDSFGLKTKLTNAGLEQTILKEFPDREGLERILHSTQRINWLRNEYNKGRILMVLGKPEKISLRYGNDGYPVDSRGKRHLTLEDVIALCQKYEIKDTRIWDEKGELRSSPLIRLKDSDFYKDKHMKED